MRVIIRFSLNRDRNSKMRNDLKAILSKYGIRWTGEAGNTRTATYEGKGIAEDVLQHAILEFWGRVHTLGSAHIDHFWMYADGEPIDADRRKVRRLMAADAKRVKN